jgi:ribonuclease E
MLINAQRTDEVRIAIVNGTTLDSYEVAATDSGLCRGNIYRAIVANLQPSLDAAFVDFGVERDGLLRADDVVLDAYHRTPNDDAKHPRVDRILERKKEILVQVVRDAVGHKGALVTSNLSIAGRYLVLMPLDDVRGVSRKLEDEEERSTIRERLERLELPEGCGVIARTNAADQPQRSLNRDAGALLRLWKKIQQEATIGKGPKLLYSDQDLIVQALRDSVDSSIEEILVDDEAAFAKAQGFMQTFMPRARTKLLPYKDRLPLFSKYQLESQIEKIYLRKVDLPAGGSIVIDGTEALTAIDVNSGRATRGSSQEETAHATNMEAASEVARQLRMRDIGGLVVVDFIDMRNAKHRRNVEKAMRDAMKDDKAKHTTSRLSANGLLEINRQRLKKALQLRTHRPCPTCSGAGTIASPELIGLNILRRIETRAVTGQLKSVRVSLHPELADALQNDLRKELADLEREFDIRVEIIAATSLHRSEERIEWNQRSKTPAAHPTETAAVTAADLADGVHSKTQKDAEPEPRDAREPQTTADKPPRKRRRGGRKRRKPSGSGEESLDAKASSESLEAPKTHDDTETARSEDDGDGNGGAGKEKPPRKRRRPRRRRKTSDSHEDSTPAEVGGESDNREDTRPEADGNESDSDKEPPKKPRKRRRGGRRRRKKPAQPVETGDNGAGTDGDGDQTPQAGSDPAPTKDEPAEAGADKPSKSRRRRPRRPRKPKTDDASKPEPAPDGDDPFSY